jgi:hypothetical protein
MRAASRAAAALGVLVAFHLFCLATIAGLLAVDAVALNRGPLFALTLILVVPVVTLLTAGLVVLASDTGPERTGVAIGRAEQDGLWALVDRVAAQLGARVPDELRLVPGTALTLGERGPICGLLPGRQTLHIGLAELAGLGSAELAAVVAGQLGRFGGRQARLAGATYRTSQSVRRGIDRLSRQRVLARTIAIPLAWLARRYDRLAGPVCRDRERATERIAAHLTGPDAATLAAGPALGRVWAQLVDRHLDPGRRSGFLPRHPVAGFLAVQADLARTEESVPVRTARRAIALLREPDTAFLAVLADWAAGPGEPVLLEWPDFAHAAMRAELLRTVTPLLDSAAALTGATGTPQQVLDLLAADRLTELGAPFAGTAPGAGPRARRELARSAVRRQLGGLALVLLTDIGAARWPLSWAPPAELVVDQPFHDWLAPLLDSAVADGGDLAGLRTLLEEAGARLSVRPTAGESATPVRKGPHPHGIR